MGELVGIVDTLSGKIALIKKVLIAIDYHVSMNVMEIKINELPMQAWHRRMPSWGRSS
jgi:hypothetical protein